MRKLLASGCLLLSCNLAACSLVPNIGKPASPTSPSPASQSFTLGAIPDRPPEQLQQLQNKLAKYLEKELKTSVVYSPKPEAAAVVNAFAAGTLDLIWVNGLAGVQARSKVSGAQAIVQRETDSDYRSVFIANKKRKIPPSVNNIKGLTALKGTRFTFGKEFSMAEHIMPQYFLQQVGVKVESFQGQAGFAESPGAIVERVESGTYDAGVLNEQDWAEALQEGKADTSKIDLIWQSPAYYDYHWVMHPNANKRLGKEFVKRVQTALLKLNPKVTEQKAILDLLGTKKLVKTENANYKDVEKIAREIGKLD